LLLKHAAKLRLNRVSLTLHHSRNHNPTGRKKIPFEHHVPNRGLLFCMRLSTKVYNFASERSLRNTCGIDTRPASTLTLSPDFSAHRLINLRTFPGNHTRTRLPRNVVQGWLYNLLFFFFVQEGVTDPPSVSSISRLLRGGGRRDADPDGKKDYTIDGILGGKS
jgi:hypothetical protein